MGGAPDYPKMSTEEHELLAAQYRGLNKSNDQLQQQYGLQNDASSALTQLAGFERGPDGKLVLSQAGQRQQQDYEHYLSNQRTLEDEISKRTLAAYKGELPVDQGLLDNLQTSEQQLRDRLAKQLGPDYEVSSAGIRALSDFERNKTAALDAARRGDIATLSDLRGTASTGPTSSPGISAGFGQLLGLTSPGGGGGGGGGEGYAQIVAQLTGQRQGEYGSQLQQYKQRADLYGGIGGTLGAVAGSFIPYAGAAGSAVGGATGNALGRSLA